MIDIGKLLTLPRWLGFWTLVLVGTTWPLWAKSSAPFQPRIPWLGIWRDVPSWIDVAGLGCLLVGCLSLVLMPDSQPRGRWANALSAGGLAIALLGDQHRLQPWAWQFLLLHAVLGWTRGPIAGACGRGLVIGIYVYSALSKFDAAFFESHGQLLLEGLLTPLSIDTRFWSPTSRRWGALAFPVGELLVAAFLTFRRSRFIGGLGSIVMHLALLWTLGWGLRHEWGVLLWNIYFVGQNVVLFQTFQPRPNPLGAAPAESTPAASRSRRSLPDRLAIGLIGLVTALPVLENIGWYDHWPAWAVYCARPERVEVLIEPQAALMLPEDLRVYLERPAPLEELVPINLDRWSFAERRCPVYPQLRYRLALAQALLHGHVPEDSVVIRVGLTPNRWTGIRETFTLQGRAQIESYCDRFLINTATRTR